MKAEQYRVPPQFDSLLAFATWFQEQPFAIPPSVFNGYNHVAGFTGLTLFKQGQFQVQLWLCPPDSVIHEHSHPNVDQFQYYISGEVYLTLNGKPVIEEDDLGETEAGLSNKNGYMIRVGPMDTHGAKIGPKGGAFINVQHWLKGEPMSVELNWEGEALDEAHAKKLLMLSIAK